MTSVAVFVPHRAQFRNITTQLPLLCSIQKERNDARVTIYTKTNNSELFRHIGLVEEVINYKGWSPFKLIAHINAHKFDEVFNIYSVSERVHGALLFSNIKKKYAFSSSKALHKFGWYDCHVLTKKHKQYIANNNLELGNEVFGTDYDTTIIKMLGHGVDNEFDQSCLTLIPCGGAGDFKVWPIEKYCEAAKYLYQHSERIKTICVILGPQESDKADTVKALLHGLPYDIVQSPTIHKLVDIASLSALTLANDCGPCHIFQMMKVPMVMIWGWHVGSHGATSPYIPILDWYHGNDHSWCVFPDERKKLIQSISVERVASLALMELNRNSHLIKTNAE